MTFEHAAQCLQRATLPSTNCREIPQEVIVNVVYQERQYISLALEVAVNGGFGDAYLFGNSPDCHMLTSIPNYQFSGGVYYLLPSY